MNLPLLETTISRHEGVRYVAYKDTMGNTTVGIGFNMDAAGAEAIFEGLGIPYSAVYEGQPLTGPEVQALFQVSLSTAIVNARRAVQNFDFLPDDAQAVVVDMQFNMGPNRFMGFQHFIAALEDNPPNYQRAIAELKSSLYCIQVGTRCTDNCSMLASI